MKFSEYNEKVEKLTDLSDDDIIIPAKHSWIREEDDNTLEHHTYHLPFDMYSVPRKYAEKFENKYSSNLSNAVYILGGNSVRYCGKATNADRASAHKRDEKKGNWLFQLLFVPNQKHSGAKRYWNVSFMELLETKLIEEFGQYFELDSDGLKNKVSGKSAEKTMKDLGGNNEEYSEFADIVVDLIVKAYVSYSKDNFISSSNDSCIEEIERVRKSPSSPFRFNMVGIKVGETVVFEPTKTEVQVCSVDDMKCINYDGQIWTLSGFVKQYIPEDQRNESNAYQGSNYFSYNGDKLTDMRKRMEAMHSEEE